MLELLSLVARGTRELGLRTLYHTVRYFFRERGQRVRFKEYIEAYVENGRSSPPALSEYRRPGRVVDCERHGQRVVVRCDNGAYTLTVLAPELIQVRLDPIDGGGLPATAAPSCAVAKPAADWPPCEFQATEDAAGNGIEIRTEKLICRIDGARGRLTFLDLDGRVISQDEAGGGWHPQGPVACRKQIQEDEHFYGLGERAFGLDLRGRRYENWNTDPRTYQVGQDPIHLCIPTLLGLHSGGDQAYAIFFDNTFRGYFDLGERDSDILSFGAENGPLRYYFIYGPETPDVLDRYTELTGRTPLPPLWMLGYHQSRWSYHPEARVRKLARDFRQVYHVPCDAIHLDIHYMDDYRCFTWDAQRFPDPVKQIDDLHEQGFKVITIIDPGIKADHEYSVCRDGLERDVFCQYPDGETLFKGPVWPGDCYFPDFTAPRVRAWWGDLYQTLVADGVDGFWNDMNEPAIFGLRSTTLPAFIQHDLDGRSGRHAEAHNVYGMQMARATVEGLRKIRPNERPVCITRSGWAGVQRYAMSWTGDNRSDWEHLWLSMPMLMNLGLSGLAHTGPDIGGYSRFASGELFTRWLQMGVFLPFLRSHTFVHSPDQEPWSWGQPYLDINRRYIELRYRLLPYLYTVLWQCHRAGRPVVRPLFWDYQRDEETYTLDDQFLCGDAFLVAPVVEEGAEEREVYLPEGVWYDFWTGQLYEGPAHIIAEAPLERLPLFVRAGSIAPMWPVMQYVGERPVEQLTLHIYPGDGESVLYEDDGRTMAFRRGAYRLTTFTLSTDADERGEPVLTLTRRAEGAYEPAYQQYEIIVVLDAHTSSYRSAQVAAKDGRRETYALQPVEGRVCLTVDAQRFDQLRLTLTPNPGDPDPKRNP